MYIKLHETQKALTCASNEVDLEVTWMYSVRNFRASSQEDQEKYSKPKHFF